MYIGFLQFCFKCHQKYENTPEPNIILNDNDFENYILTWETHFIKIMNPKFIPNGWSLIIKNFDTSFNK